MADTIESSYQAAIDGGSINGAVICATDAEGRFVYNKAIGERTLLSGEKKPQQIDDVLFLASATKLITTIAALQCVEDGLLELKGDVSAIAPELAALNVLTGWADDETPLLEQQTRPITLEMLLTHSSGLNHDFLYPDIGKWTSRFLEVSNDDRLPVEGIFKHPLGFQPGSGWMYGPGIDWAGRIVERVTGRSLGENIQQRIFDPLGIRDAEFYPVMREDLKARQVDRNPADPEGVGLAVAGSRGNLNLRTKGHFGGQGLYMTAIDYTKILHSLLANNGKILQSVTIDGMFEHHLGPKETVGQQAALASPMGALFRLGVSAGTSMGHGLGGMLILEDLDGWHGERTMAWGGGLTFVWFIDRKNDLCGVGAVLSAIPVNGDIIAALKRTFREDIYKKRAVWKTQ